MKSKPTEELIELTREAAIALVEDFSVLRDISDRVETRPVDLRHASAILRRWLCEGQLGRIAAPRVGRLRVGAIDNNPVYRAERSGGIITFVSGGARIYGVDVAAGLISEVRRVPEIPDYHPDKWASFGLETFLKQRVIYYQGEWFTRHQVIKFVAHADYGVHGHGAKEEWEKRLSGFREAVSVSLVAGPDGEPVPSVAWRTGPPLAETGPRKYDPRMVNGILLEVLSTINFLVHSPELIRLIEIIRAENA